MIKISDISKIILKYYKWIIIIISIILLSFIISNVISYYFNDENSGSYLIAITSTIGVIITIIMNKNNLDKQMKENNHNILLQLKYERFEKMKEDILEEIEEFKILKDLIIKWNKKPIKNQKRFLITEEEFIRYEYYFFNKKYKSIIPKKLKIATSNSKTFEKYSMDNLLNIYNRYRCSCCENAYTDPYYELFQNFSSAYSHDEYYRDCVDLYIKKLLIILKSNNQNTPHLSFDYNITKNQILNFFEFIEEYFKNNEIEEILKDKLEY